MPGPSTGSTGGVVDDGRILFTTEMDGKVQQLLYIDRNGVHQINIDDPTLGRAQWASQRIVFHSERAGNRHIFSMARDGTGVVQLTSGATSAEEFPHVSSDGLRIAYSRFVWETGQDLGLQSIDSNGRDLVQLTPPGATGTETGASEPAWAPDGSSVAYVQVLDWEGKGAGLFLQGPDGEAPVRLTSDEVDPGYPRVSPDGRWVLYTPGFRGGPSDGRLHVVSVDGSEFRTLPGSNGPGMDFEGEWSPDGSEIVFKYYESGWDHNELRTMDADGTNVRILWTGGPGLTAETPDWGP